MPPPFGAVRAVSDQDVLDASRGDERAVAHLIESYRPRVERHAKRRMRPRLARFMGAEDIAQESLLAAITSMGRAGVHRTSDFERYLYSITEKRVRHAGRRWEVGSIEEVVLPEPEDPENEPSDGLVSNEERRGVRRSLARLHDDHRWVLVLRDYLGTSWETAALALDRPSTHAAQCLYDRARTALGRRIQS